MEALKLIAASSHSLLRLPSATSSFARSLARCSTRGTHLHAAAFHCQVQRTRADVAVDLLGRSQEGAVDVLRSPGRGLQEDETIRLGEGLALLRGDLPPGKIGLVS